MVIPTHGMELAHTEFIESRGVMPKKGKWEKIDG